MKIAFFHLMPYRFQPPDFEARYPSVGVDVSASLFDAERARGLYHEFLDELEHAEAMGFDGLCVNAHHQNAAVTAWRPGSGRPGSTTSTATCGTSATRVASRR